MQPLNAYYCLYYSHVKKTIAMKHILIITLIILPFIGFTQNLLTFTGQIINIDNGKTINDASIWIAEEKIGTISDYNGEFILHLPTGNYKITITADNYNEETFHIILVDNINQEIKITAKNNKKRKNLLAKKQKNQKRIPSSFDISYEIAELHSNTTIY